MNGEVGVGLADGANQYSSSVRLEQTGHILDTEDVDALLDELGNEVQVVLEGVFGLLGAGDIPAVAHDGLDDTTCLLSSVDTQLHVLEVVQRVEDTEDVETILDSLLGELVDGVVATEAHQPAFIGSSRHRLTDSWCNRHR